MVSTTIPNFLKMKTKRLSVQDPGTAESEHREDKTGQLVVAGAFSPVFKQKYTSFGHALSRANKKQATSPWTSVERPT